MKLDIAFDGLDDTLLTLQALPRQIEAASRRAVAKVTGQTRRAILQELASGAGVTQKLLVAKRRVLQSLPRPHQGDRPGGSVWVGTRALQAGYLVTSAQRRNLLLGKRVRGGARAGRHFFPGAFWAELPGGHVGIFKRRGRARLPIDEQTVPLAVSPAARVRIAGQVAERLTKAMQHEIRFEVLHAKRRR